MCVGYAARISSLLPEQKYAEVECMGIHTTVNIALLEDLAIDDYVLVHAGVALEKITQELADELLAIHEKIGLASDE